MMSIVLGIVTVIATIVLCALMIYAGMMRTTGATQEDSRNVKGVFWIGMLLAALMIGSHWIGW